MSSQTDQRVFFKPNQLIPPPMAEVVWSGASKSPFEIRPDPSSPFAPTLWLSSPGTGQNPDPCPPCPCHRMWRRSRYVTPQQPRAKPYLRRGGGECRRERARGRGPDRERAGGRGPEREGQIERGPEKARERTKRKGNRGQERGKERTHREGKRGQRGGT